MTAGQLIGILLWLMFPVVCGIVAYGKERNTTLWVVLGFFFGVFALVVIALLPDANKWNAIERRAPALEPPLARPGRVETYGKCPECGRLAFTADDDGDYYCYACGKTVQVAT